MKRIFVACAVLAFALIASLQPVHADMKDILARGVIRIGTQLNSPPFGFIDTAGAPTAWISTGEDDRQGAWGKIPTCPGYRRKPHSLFAHRQGRHIDFCDWRDAAAGDADHVHGRLCGCLYWRLRTREIQGDRPERPWVSEDRMHPGNNPDILARSSWRPTPISSASRMMPLRAPHS